MRWRPASRARGWGPRRRPSKHYRGRLSPRHIYYTTVLGRKPIGKRNCSAMSFRASVPFAYAQGKLCERGIYAEIPRRFVPRNDMGQQCGLSSHHSTLIPLPSITSPIRQAPCPIASIKMRIPSGGTATKSPPDVSGSNSSHSCASANLPVNLTRGR